MEEAKLIWTPTCLYMYFQNLHGQETRKQREKNNIRRVREVRSDMLQQITEDTCIFIVITVTKLDKHLEVNVEV